MKFCYYVQSLNLTSVPASVFSQPIISKAKPQLLKTHFLPLMDKLKKVSTALYIMFCFVFFKYKTHLNSAVRGLHCYIKYGPDKSSEVWISRTKARL